MFLNTKLSKISNILLNLIFSFVFLANTSYAEQIGRFTASHSSIDVYYGLLGNNSNAGLVFEIELPEKWHTYYKDPGDTGYGLQLTLVDDKGKVYPSNIIWEKPKKFQFLGSDYLGYSGKPLFFVPLDSSKPLHELRFIVDYLICKTTCVPQFIEGNLTFPVDISLLNTDIQSRYLKSEHDNSGLIYSPPFFQFLVFAFFGGLILNLMPCVFPVLSLKLLGLISQTSLTSRDRVIDSLYYALGILVSFTFLVILIFLIKSFGVAVGWGFQMQNPFYVFSLIIILSWVMWHLLDIIPLPQWIATLPSKTSGISSTHPFWTGVLVTLVATPCTAPFMAPAIGTALSFSFLKSFAIFQFLALGLAFPFVIVAFIPGFFSYFPKPGPWMVSVKYFSAFPMCLAIIWLVWVLQQQIGLYAIFIGFVVVLTIYSIGLLIKNQRGSLVKYVCSVLIFLAFLISQLSQPAVQFFETKSVKRFSIQRLNDLRKQNIPVFVDVTAAWCLTCQYNERTVLHSEQVQKLFSENNVVTLLADWTNRDEVIGSYLSSFNREGVPMYVYYPVMSKPVLLPELLNYSLLKKLFTSVE